MNKDGYLYKGAEVRNLNLSLSFTETKERKKKKEKHKEMKKKKTFTLESWLMSLSGRFMIDLGMSAASDPYSS